MHNAEMIETVKRIVSALHLTGLIGFDFMIETGTGAAWVIEMNPRNTPVCAQPWTGTQLGGGARWAPGRQTCARAADTDRAGPHRVFSRYVAEGPVEPLAPYRVSRCTLGATVVVVAIAREIAGFLWAIAHQVAPLPAPAVTV